MSEKWMLAQMKHHVSAEAANAFWDLAFKYVQPCLQQRQKRIPKFVQQRRKLIEDNCPEVHMEFTYRNKITGQIVKYKGKTAPVKMYETNSNYEKLYEMAYVKVKAKKYMYFKAKYDLSKPPVLALL